MTPASERTVTSQRNLASVFWHLFAFTVGLTVEIEFELVGTLRISELILLGYIVSMTFFGRLPELFRIPFAKPIASFGVLWLVAQFVSDSINDTSRINSLKGMAMIVMIMVSVAAVVLLFRPDPNRYASYLAGLVGSRLYDSLFGSTDPFGSQEHWDVHIAGWAGPGLILITLFFLQRRVRPLIPVLLLVLYGCVSIVFAARSHGMVFIVTGMGLLYGCINIDFRLANFQRRQIIPGAIVLGLVLMVLFQVFVYFGLRGTLGSGTRRQLARSGNPYNPVSVLIAGRGSLPTAIRAISDRPWFGHGSRAYNPKYANAITRLRGINVIPAHSCLLSAWVFAGILSLPFWIAVLTIHTRILLFALNHGHAQFVLLSAYLFMDGFWNIFFSPMGYARFPWPPLLAVNIILYQQALAKQTLAEQTQGLEPIVREVTRGTPSLR